MRTFDQKENLLDAGGYEIGWEARCHLEMRFGHLLYQDREIFDADRTPVVVFHIADDSSMDVIQRLF